MNGVTRGDPVQAAQSNTRRIEALERRLTASKPSQPKPVRGEKLGPWGNPGDEVEVAQGAEDEVRWGGKSLDLVVRLTDAVSGDTTVEAYVNGALEGSVTVASGLTAARSTIGVRTSPGDTVRCDVSAAGTGDTKLSANVWVNT